MYEQILADIANFKIRGAENICKWGVLAFSLKVQELNEKCSFISTYIKSLEKSKKEIISIRPNEVALSNSLNYILNTKSLNKLSSLEEIKSEVESRLRSIESRINYSMLKISLAGLAKIKEGFQVYTHGHSSLVENLFEEASKKIKFSVNITESITPFKDYIKSLSKVVKLNYYPFFMVEDVVIKSDMIFIGCTAIKKDKALCQAGSSAVVSLAKVFDVPVYLVCDILKYSSNEKYDLESLTEEEVCSGVPSGVNVIANELDAVEARLFDGVICEEGIFSVKDFEDISKKEIKFT